MQLTTLLSSVSQLAEMSHWLGYRDALVTATIYAHVTDEQIETASETFAHAMTGN